MPEPLLKRIVARAAGVPLFVQELARLVSETGEGASTEAALPDRLRDLFTIRLDRLGPAKRIASLAAVVGPLPSSDPWCVSCRFTVTGVQRALSRKVVWSSRG